MHPSASIEAVRGAYTITTDPDRLDHETVRRFLADAYWASDRPAEVIERSLENSLVFALLHEGTQVGMARVVSDYATFAWLCDVYIDPGHRGGLGQWLMEVVSAHPDLQGLRTWMLGTSYSHSLYARFGFRDVPPDRFMYRRQESRRDDAPE